MKIRSLAVAFCVLCLCAAVARSGHSGGRTDAATEGAALQAATADSTPATGTRTAPLDPAAARTAEAPSTAVAASGAGAGPADRSHAGKSATGVTAPDFNLPLSRGTVSLDSLRGKVVLVDFWASWCDPCKKSFPWMKSIYDRYSAKGLRIVAIDLDKNRDAADEFLDRNASPFIVAFDPSGKTAEAYRVSAMPSSYLIGPTGAIVYSHKGFDLKGAEALESLINQECTSQ